MRLSEMIYTEEEYKELADELEYVRIIKDSAEKTLKEVREENKKLKSDLSLVIKERDDNIEQNKKLSEENGQLKKDNEYRKKIVDIIPLDEKSVAEETIKDLLKEIKRLKDNVAWYEKEEDRLKEINENLDAENRNLRQYYDRDKEELSESCYDLTRENEKLNKRIKELEQCNLNLQTWIDNKEKVNKSMREELQRYKDMLDSWEF